MRLSIKNGKSWQRKHTRAFIQWFVQRYLSEGRKKALEIDVLITDDLKETDGNQATCDQVTREKYVLTLYATKNIPIEGFLQLLAHEMVHVKQYVKGELVDLDDEKHPTRFLNKSYNSEYNYWESPWEIEAHGRERGLMSMYAAEHKVRIKKFIEQRKLSRIDKSRK